jgi:hypothetical protein
MSKTAATEATAKMTTTNGVVTLELSTGETYTTKDSNGFLGRLDRKIGADGWTRAGYRTVDGVMITTFARTRLLADFVAAR